MYCSGSGISVLANHDKSGICLFLLMVIFVDLSTLNIFFIPFFIIEIVKFDYFLVSRPDRNQMVWVNQLTCEYHVVSYHRNWGKYGCDLIVDLFAS